MGLAFLGGCVLLSYPHLNITPASHCAWWLLRSPHCSQGWIDRSILDRTVSLLRAANLPITVPPPMTPQLFKDLMAVDKKVAAGKLRLILLKGPLGSCVVTGDFDPAKLEETLNNYCAHLNA
jgi:3-dehydroquinate synthetase